MKRLTLLIGLVMLFSLVSVSATWWDENWNARVEINISDTYVDSDLTDFPHLVKLNSSIINFSSALTNGEDIRFINSTHDGELDFEIERWNQTTEEAEIWVKIPTLSSSQVTKIYLYYDNALASDGQNPIDVWSSGYTNVQHFNEYSGTTSYDSTGAFNGTYNGEVTNGAVGQIDGSYNFSGFNGNYTTIQNFNADHTWVASNWFKLYSLSTDHNFFSDDEHTLFYVSSGGKVRCGTDDGVSPKYIESTSTISLNTWNHVVCEHSNSTGTRLYVNGVLESSNAGVYSAYNRGGTPNIGCSYSTSNCMNGSIDEFRLSTKERSSDWHKAEYYSQTNSMNSFGQNFFNAKGQIFKISPVEGSTNSPFNVNFTVRADSSLGLNITNITIKIYDPSDSLETTQFFDYSGSPKTSVISSFIYNFTGSYFGNESWKWSVDMCSVNGQCSPNNTNFTGQENTTFYIDSILPNITLLNPTLEGDKSSVRLQYSYDELNVDSCWYSIDGGSNTSHSCVSVSSTISISEYGFYNITFFMNYNLPGMK